MGATLASRATAYPLMSLYTRWLAPSPATCDAVVPDPTHAHVVYATFSAYQRGGQYPPEYRVLYLTRDGGRTWSPVASPPGYDAVDFAGISASRTGVTVMYAPLPDLAQWRGRALSARRRGDDDRR